MVAARARRILAEARRRPRGSRGASRRRAWRASGSERCCPPAMSTSPACSSASASAHPAVEVGLREGIAATCSAIWPPMSSMPPSVCSLARPPPNSAIQRLSHDEAVAAYAPARRAPLTPHVTVADLQQHPIVAMRRGSAITLVVDELFTAAGTDPSTSPSKAATRSCCGPSPPAAFAIAILPRSMLALEGPALEVRSLHPAVRLPVALVRRRQRHLPPAVSMFIDFVRGETPSDSGSSTGRHRDLRRRSDPR